MVCPKCISNKQVFRKIEVRIFEVLLYISIIAPSEGSILTRSRAHENITHQLFDEIYNKQTLQVKQLTVSL